MNFKNQIDKDKYIANILKIMAIELDNYNLTADYGDELTWDDIINHIKQNNKL